MSEPYLRPASPEGVAPAPCPAGHLVEPAGHWEGRRMEVVYDPRRFDVAFLRGSSSRVRDGLARTSWERSRTDGDNEMWIRDRALATRRRLWLQKAGVAGARRS